MCQQKCTLFKVVHRNRKSGCRACGLDHYLTLHGERREHGPRKDHLPFPAKPSSWHGLGEQTTTQAMISFILQFPRRERIFISQTPLIFFFFNHGLDTILCAHLSWPLPPTYPTQSSCLHSPASSNANKTRGISDWWNLTDFSRDW